MKKIVISIIIILFVFIICSKNNNTIRFRVIANSNSDEDIRIKEEVVKELSTYLFKDKSYYELKEYINNNINNINNSVNKVFEINKYNKTYNVIYGYNYFPTKKYKNKTYQAGEYESLVIKIGEAKGDNYWCFLYPSLCIEDYNFEEKHEYKFKIIEIIKDFLSVKEAENNV